MSSDLKRDILVLENTKKRLNDITKQFLKSFFFEELEELYCEILNTVDDIDSVLRSIREIGDEK